MVDVITADVRISELLDRLVVTPRRPGDLHAVSGMLREALPGVRVARGADGVWIPGPYSARLLNATLHAELKWSPEARRFSENRGHVSEVHKRVYQEVLRIREGGRAVAEEYLPAVAHMDILDDHQRVNVAAMTLPDGFGLCVFDEQGTGKTVTLIFALDVLMEQDQMDFALIVAPKSMVPEWVCDFDRFKGDLYKVRVLSGTRQQKMTTMGECADVLVTNYETVVSMENELRASFRRRQGRAVLVVDESFFMKNLDAKRTRALRMLREWCGRAFVLCGTPAPNAPQDLVQQFNIVDFGMTFSGVNVPEGRQQALPVVQQAIEERGIFVRHLKVDVLPDLPVKRFHRLLLPLKHDQKKLYTAALKDYILDLRSVGDEMFQRRLTSFLARRMSLLQICSNPTLVAPGYDEVPAKLEALDDLLDELIGRRAEKVVLWSFYTASLDAIVARYCRFNPVRYDGSVTEIAMRREAVRRFQEDDETMLFVANPAAAGAGLTLHRARYAIYESMSNQAAHYLQSVDRIHRRGQTRDVEYLVLLCDRTIEVEEYERLTLKERAAQSLLRDHVESPLTRETMLEEAMVASRFLGEEM